MIPVEAAQLKCQLSALRDAGWQFDDPQIGIQMMVHIGDPDPELRDALIYEGLCALIAGPFLQPKHLTDLMVRATRGLLFGLDHPGDATLTRSFCSLVAAELVCKDTTTRCLADQAIGDLWTAVQSYCRHEHDTRGYDAQLGWVHAVAHFADLVDAMLRSPRLEPPQKSELILGLIALLCRMSEPLCHDEDERVVTAVLTALHADLISVEQVLSVPPPAITPRYVAEFNRKVFLKSLLLRLQACGGQDTAQIAGAIRDMAPWFYETQR